MSYISKLNPKVGGGLGGLPQRTSETAVGASGDVFQGYDYWNLASKYPIVPRVGQVLTDSNDNIVQVISEYVSGNYYTAVYRKYTPKGMLLWESMVARDPQNLSLYVYNSAVDSEGNVYGIANDNSSPYRNLIYKLHHKTGKIVWSYYAVFGSYNSEYGSGIYVDDNDVIYTSFSYRDSDRMLFARFDADGNILTNTGTGFGNYINAGNGIHVDESGNIYASLYNATRIIKISSDFSTTLYSKSISGASSLSCTYQNNGDKNGNLHFTGFYNAGYSRGIIFRIDSDGNVVWQKYVSSSSSTNYFSGAHIDDDGNVYTICYVNSKIILVKISATGSVLMNKTIHNGGYAYTSNDSNNYVTVDSEGNIIANIHSSTYDSKLIKISPSASEYEDSTEVISDISIITTSDSSFGETHNWTSSTYNTNTSITNRVVGELTEVIV